jgi:hypothetical protein
LRANRAATAAVTAQLLNTLPILDLTVEEPAIEAVIDQIYRAKSVMGPAATSHGDAAPTLEGALGGTW